MRPQATIIPNLPTKPAAIHFLCLFPKSTPQMDHMSIFTHWDQLQKGDSWLCYPFFWIHIRGFLMTKWNLWLPNATKYQRLSIHSFSAAILPEPRPPILLNDVDNPLKLLLPSLKLRDFLAFLNFGELMSPMSRSASSWFSIFTTTRWAMVLRQNGHTGGVRHAVVGFGLLWQHRASVHCAHIWWPQSWTSIVHTCSKHMQHNSVSLACIEWEQINLIVSKIKKCSNK